MKGNKMAAKKYKSVVPSLITTLAWPEDTLEDIQTLVGSVNVRPIPGGIQILNSYDEWVTLGNGWIIAVNDKGERMTMSPNSLNVLKYEQVES
jgi:hypothetical protein